MMDKPKNIKVVLISMYDLDALAIHTFHSILDKNGFSVNSIFFKAPRFIGGRIEVPSFNEIDALVHLIKELDPDLVGVSLRSLLFELASHITKRVKETVDTLVIWGGVHPTTSPGQCLEFADIICIGEGEIPILDLAKRLSQEDDINNINNLWIKMPGGNIIKNNLNLLIQDLDSIPFPDYLNKNKYFLEKGKVTEFKNIYSPKNEYVIMTTRGCPYSCAYCCNSILRKIYTGKGQYLRRRSVKNVIAELLLAKEEFKHLSSIVFIDEVFTFDKNWLKEFSEEYKKKIGLPFTCYTHPKMINEEIVMLLKEAGLTQAELGIQTGSESIRYNCFHRYDTNENIIRTSQLLNKHGIARVHDLILDNPFENEEDRREALELLLKLPRPYELNTYTLTWFPETDLTRLALKEKLISENDIEDKAKKGFEHWVTCLDLSRSKESLFWDNLYYLAHVKGIPKGIILWLSHLDVLRKHPSILTHFLRLFSTSPWCVSNSRIGVFRQKLLIRIKRVVQAILTGITLVAQGNFLEFCKRLRRLMAGSRLR